jgi:hypothetical protein
VADPKSYLQSMDESQFAQMQDHHEQVLPSVGLQGPHPLLQAEVMTMSRSIVQIAYSQL